VSPDVTLDPFSLVCCVGLAWSSALAALNCMGKWQSDRRGHVRKPPQRLRADLADSSSRNTGLITRFDLALLTALLILATPLASWNGLGSENSDSKDLQSLFVRGRDFVAEDKTEEGLRLIRQAGSNGLLRAQVTLAEMLLNPTNTLSREEGLYWALLAGRQADPAMRTRLVSELRFGDAASLFRESWPWLCSLASNGQPPMAFRAGLWAFFGYGGRRDFDSALSWLSIANQNEAFQRQAPQCSYLVAYLLENGYASKQDYGAAAKLYWEAAELGWPDAVYRLALLIEHGQGTVQNTEVANLLYHRAGELGISQAAYRLGLLVNAKGAQPETRLEAFGWFLQAATNGLSMGQTKVGLAYEQGWSGQGTDPVQALAWYKIAARSGNRGARIKVEKLERSLSELQRSSLAGRLSVLSSLLVEPRPRPKSHPGESLFPPGVAARKNELLESAESRNPHKARTLAEARLGKERESSKSPAGGRGDLQSGTTRIYLDGLQNDVRQLVSGRLTDLGNKGLWPDVPNPQDMEVILAFRLCSDGRAEDVEVVDTNLSSALAAVFSEALEDVLPGPRWTPRLRAELSDEYQDLLLAFGPKSILRISQ
jgi:TPR repeat protein